MLNTASSPKKLFVLLWASIVLNLRAAGSWSWVPPARDSSETAGTIILRMAGNILQ